MNDLSGLVRELHRITRMVVSVPLSGAGAQMLTKSALCASQQIRIPINAHRRFRRLSAAPHHARDELQPQL